MSAELQSIQGLYGGDLLLNQDFLVSRLEKQLREEQFTVVHIASHGRFESDVAKTFLLTFDDKLTMERLDQFVGLFRFRDEPLELLALSACETAAGDDRAALGLAGVAIKAGARSALATLWGINDPASSTLIAEFYRQFRDPSVSRAVALQRAQLKLLHDPRYQHPGYWSAVLADQQLAVKGAIRHERSCVGSYDPHSPLASWPAPWCFSVSWASAEPGASNRWSLPPTTGTSAYDQVLRCRTLGSCSSPSRNVIFVTRGAGP